MVEYPMYQQTNASKLEVLNQYKNTLPIKKKDVDSVDNFQKKLFTKTSFSDLKDNKKILLTSR